MDDVREMGRTSWAGSGPLRCAPGFASKILTTTPLTLSQRIRYLRADPGTMRVYRTRSGALT